MKKEAFGYLRVSTRKQIDGDGPERQRTHIQQWADRNGFTVVKYFTDAFTGKSTGATADAVKVQMKERQAMTEMLAASEATGIKTVIVEKADRFARDVIVSELFIREFRESGIALIDAETGEDMTIADDRDPTGKLIRQVLACVAEYIRAELVMKMRLSRERKKAAGIRQEGVKPFGFFPREKATVATIRAMYTQGASYTRIAEALDERALQGQECGPRGGGEWARTSVRAIVMRAGWERINPAVTPEKIVRELEPLELKEPEMAESV